MKNILLLFGLCFCLFATNAQTRADVKLYGYVRPVTGGASPKISNRENSQQLLSYQKAKYTYLIYLEGPVKTRIYPVDMYVNGERRGVKVSPVSNTPVEIKTGDIPEYSKTITLVPKTSGKVYRLDLGTPAPGKEMETARTKALDHELVVVYKYAGKFYYAVQKKLKMLEPVVLQ